MYRIHLHCHTPTLASTDMEHGLGIKITSDLVAINLAYISHATPGQLPGQCNMFSPTQMNNE